MKSPDQLSDIELILQARGDNRAFLDELIKRHLSAVYAICYQYLKNSEDAQDATQQTFIKVWKHLRRFDTGKDFNNWLHEIAKNTCLDMIKKHRALPLELLEHIPSTLPAPDEQAEEALRAQRLHRAIQTLPAIYQTVLSLYYETGLNLRQIAEKEHLPVDTVKSRHRRALKALRRKLTQDQPK